MSIELQRRDYALLFYTWQSRFMAQRQYRRRFWEDSSQAAVAKRLIELVDANLLRTHKMPWRSDRVLYSLTLAGTRALNSYGLTQVRVGDYPKPANDFTPGMKHDLDLVDIRIACEEGGHLEWWTSEHELRLARKQGQGPVRITDGVFDYADFWGKKKGILEYERMAYRRTKFHDILMRLKIADGEHKDLRVFFVCQDARRAETLWGWAKEIALWRMTPERLLFGHFEAVKEKGLEGGFFDLNGHHLVMPKVTAAE